MPAPIDRPPRPANAAGARHANPLPKVAPRPHLPIDWPVSRTVALWPPVPPPVADFAAVMGARKSLRRILRSSLRETVNFLAFACAPRSTWGNNNKRSSRPSHSAGALHPVEVLLVAGPRRDRVFRVDPLRNVLQSLQTPWAAPLRSLDASLSAMLPEARCDYLVLLADPAVTDACYFDPQSLMWRDAGALMQTLHFCATAYRLAFCPAGITGTEVAEATFGAGSRLIGAGVAVVGRQDER